MRRFIFAIALCLTLSVPALTPVHAASSVRHHDLIEDFRTGARFYASTIGGWLDRLFRALGVTRRPALKEGALCDQQAACASGLTCLNTCTGSDCAMYEKRCRPGAFAKTLGEFSPCTDKDLCEDGTVCVNLCLPGTLCNAPRGRCLKPVAPSDRCASDAECAAACGRMAFPPIGPAGYVALCAEGSCHCQAFSIQPDAPRKACPEPTGLACPTGTHPACTPSIQCPDGDCPPIATCLSAPEYGGACLNDAECTRAECPTGAAPFCDADRRCKCRGSQTQTVRCRTGADCTASCGSGQVGVCLDGSCGCAKAGTTTACRSVSDCSTDCPAGAAPECQAGSCICRKTTEAPVGCTTINDCAAVACPAGYEKECRDRQCACTRLIQIP